MIDAQLYSAQQRYQQQQQQSRRNIISCDCRRRAERLWHQATCSAMLDSARHADKCTITAAQHGLLYKAISVCGLHITC